MGLGAVLSRKENECRNDSSYNTLSLSPMWRARFAAIRKLYLRIPDDVACHAESGSLDRERSFLFSHFSLSFLKREVSSTLNRLLYKASCGISLTKRNSAVTMIKGSSQCWRLVNTAWRRQQLFSVGWKRQPAFSSLTSSSVDEVETTSPLSSLWNPTEDHVALRSMLRSFVAREVSKEGALLRDVQSFALRPNQLTKFPTQTGRTTS